MIHKYDPTWPERFAELSGNVTSALGSLVLRVEHVGSTAVPGLAAKPVIDMDVILTRWADFPSAIRALGGIGYVHEGDLGVTGREAFRWPPGQARHHLYVLAPDALELRRHLAFRDALRENPALRDDYAALKRQLCARHPFDRVSYTDAKSAFINAAIGAYP